MKNKLVFKIKGLSYEDLVENHNKYINFLNSEVIFDRTVRSANGWLSPCPRFVEKEGEKRKFVRKSTMLPKYIFLIDRLIRICMNNEDYIYKADYRIMSEVLGDHYSDMLKALQYMDIIMIDGSYQPNDFSRYIRLNKHEIESIGCKNKRVFEFQKRYKELLDKKHQEYRTKLVDTITKANLPFTIEEYESCLSYLTISHRTEAKEYINSIEDVSKRNRYATIIETFNPKELKIKSIDEQKRIYHYLTNLPRNLKRFYNIKYEVDVRNSHPLILCYFLIKELDIDIDAFYFLYNKIRNKYHDTSLSFHIVSKELCNKLNISRIEHKFKINEDVIRYIIATSEGRFWDDFLNTEALSKEVQNDRNKLKEMLFSHVFYADHIIPSSIFIKHFKEFYPTIWQIIKGAKMALNRQGTNLARVLMKWESILIQEVLTECYKRKYKVVHIHDAIIVFDCEENKEVTSETVAELFKVIYFKHKLQPTVSIKAYSKAA